MREKLVILLGILLTGFLGIVIYPTAVFGWRLPEMGWAAWVHLVPLFVVLYVIESKFRRFWAAFLCAFIFYGGALYWLIAAMKNFGGLSFWQSTGVLSLVVAILSFYFSMAITLAYGIHERTRFPLSFLITSFIVSFDFLRIYFPVGGFPWPMAAYSQGSYLLFFQWLDVTGVFGLNALIILINALLAEMIWSWFSRHAADALLRRSILIILLALVSFYGSIYQHRKMESEAAPVLVDSTVTASPANLELALIQGNIGQSLKWERHLSRQNLQIYLDLTDQAAREGVDLVIWPETAYPYTLDLSEPGGAKLFEAELQKVPVLLGSVSEIPQIEGEDPVVTNSAVMVQGGRAAEIYHKRHLVPFGEYVPMKEQLTFAKRLTTAVGDFTPGTLWTLLPFKEIKLGALVCYEDIFPDIARGLVSQGADLLVNLTNDAWYGNSSAPYQHLVFSQFRALENRRYLVRATNTGVTAVIDPRGKVLNVLPMFKRDTLRTSFNLEKKEAFYTFSGDWVAWGAVMFSVLMVCYSLFRGGKNV